MLCRLLFVLFCCLNSSSWAGESVLSYAYSLNGGAVLGNHVEVERPLMSVFKLHLSIAILQKMQREGTGLDATVAVPAKAWELDTWSPLREKYRGQSVSLSLRELLASSVSQSDNITTDVLIDYLGGIAALQSAMQGRAVLQVNEAQMSEDVENCRLNVATPASVVELLRDLLAGRLLDSAYTDFLVSLLIATETGANKIKASLPVGTVVGHKTGSSGRDALGRKIADNDAGFILLPDGRVLTLCIFVTDATCSDAACAAHIASIAQELYQHYTNPSEQ